MRTEHPLRGYAKDAGFYSEFFRKPVEDWSRVKASIPKVLRTVCKGPGVEAGRPVRKLLL